LSGEVNAGAQVEFAIDAVEVSFHCLGVMKNELAASRLVAPSATIRAHTAVSARRLEQAVGERTQQRRGARRPAAGC